MVQVFRKEFQISFVRRYVNQLKGVNAALSVSYEIPDSWLDGRNGPPWESLADSLVFGVLLNGYFRGGDISRMDGSLILDADDPLCFLLENSGCDICIFKFNGVPTVAGIGNVIASLLYQQSEYEEHSVKPSGICFSVGDESILVEW